MRHIALAVLALALAEAGPAAEPLETSPESVSRSFVALAWGGRIDDALALTVPDAAGRATFERQLRSLHRMRCVDLLGVRATTRELRAGAAVVDVDTAVRKSDPRSPDQWFPPETAPLRLGLIQSESRWLISSIAFPEEELADLLVA